MSSNVTEPSRELNQEGSGTTYDKAKSYWQNVEPSVCGMLGGLPEVGFIGKSKGSSASLVSMTKLFDFRHSSVGELP